MLAYFDCFCGISGDMSLGALIDLGVPSEWLAEALAGLHLKGFEIDVSAVSRHGIQAKRARVKTADRKSRNFARIRSLIEDAELPEGVQTASLEIFRRLARAEAAIHGEAIDQVHFHEVGGLDAIVDIVGTALCMQHLGITDVVASEIALGKGLADCHHGSLPVPVPATVSILKDIPVMGTEISHELVTPTGAAIIASLAQSFGPVPEMIINKIGYGAGERDHASRPNLLRIIAGERAADQAGRPKDLKTDRVTVLEASIDDMNPELYGYLMERLFAEGALDVLWVPVYMKKNRPGTLIQVLCPEARRDTLIRRILSETTSLGVRYYDARRRILERDTFEIETSFGTVTVKRIRGPVGELRVVPEYETCRKIALEKKIPMRVVYETILREAAAAGDRK